ncbi:hypothetical protein EK904_007886, partial [Melospiza melodia maxima]
MNPNGKGPRLPEVYCVISRLGCFDLFSKVIELRRPMDSRLEHVDFECLFRCLSVRQIIRIFASLLLERRVIFVADKLSSHWTCPKVKCVTGAPLIRNCSPAFARQGQFLPLSASLVLTEERQVASDSPTSFPLPIATARDQFHLGII